MANYIISEQRLQELKELLNEILHSGTTVTVEGLYPRTTHVQSIIEHLQSIDEINMGILNAFVDWLDDDMIENLRIQKKRLINEFVASVNIELLTQNIIL